MSAVWALVAVGLALVAALVDMRRLGLVRPVRTPWGTVPLYWVCWLAAWAGWLFGALVLTWAP